MHRGVVDVDVVADVVDVGQLSQSAGHLSVNTSPRIRSVQSACLKSRAHSGLSRMPLHESVVEVVDEETVVALTVVLVVLITQLPHNTGQALRSAGPTRISLHLSIE